MLSLGADLTLSLSFFADLTLSLFLAFLTSEGLGWTIPASSLSSSVVMSFTKPARANAWPVCWCVGSRACNLATAASISLSLACSASAFSFSSRASSALRFSSSAFSAAFLAFCAVVLHLSWFAGLVPNEHGSDMVLAG